MGRMEAIVARQGVLVVIGMRVSATSVVAQVCGYCVCNILGRASGVGKAV